MQNSYERKLGSRVFRSMNGSGKVGPVGMELAPGGPVGNPLNCTLSQNISSLCVCVLRFKPGEQVRILEKLAGRKSSGGRIAAINSKL